jgi:hypothetical protein
MIICVILFSISCSLLARSAWLFLKAHRIATTVKVPQNPAAPQIDAPAASPERHEVMMTVREIVDRTLH